jgi:hypothetical protein
MWANVYLKKLTGMSTLKKLKISFVNPPHADWSLASNLTYLLCQSHYSHHGKYADSIEWLPAPYKWNSYQSYEEVYEEIKDADIVMFSCYIWNYTIQDKLARLVKQCNPKTITVLGGPHIGTNDPGFLLTRNCYDFVCQPTKPGEVFVEDLIDSWFENDGNPVRQDVSWEVRSTKTRDYNFAVEYSVYEEHVVYLKELVDYARVHKMEPLIVLETTRGCPYKCVFCEWGGGIGTKIHKKSLDIVKRDIDALKSAGYMDAHMSDANFGVFEERDLEIFRYAWQNDINLTDISTVKAKSLERRKRLIDAWFEIVGTEHRTKEIIDASDMWDATRRISVVPTVSIQSISDEAMKVADRVDLSLQDKLELSRYINERCQTEGYPVPALELILAMPGSTLLDFYEEMEIIWNFKSWGSYRHDYMFLPDSRLSSKEYQEKYAINTVEVFSDITDDDGVDSWNSSLYRNKKSSFSTTLSCYSYSREEMKEMWFMNIAGNYLLEHAYMYYQEDMTPAEFTKSCYNVITQLDEFKYIKTQIDDIFNPDTPARSIRQLNGKYRVDAIEEMLEANLLLIKNLIVIEQLL